MVRLIRTVFCRFPSYELAEHPCIRLTTSLFSGADILAVNADQSISFDICEERSECLFYLQNEMRRAGITQKDIDKARKSQEVSLIEHCKELRYVTYSARSN